MSKFKTYFTINCYSFTFLILIYALLAKLELFPPLTIDSVFVHFLMTLCGTLLIALTDRLPIGNELLASFIRIVDVAVAVFGIGFTFDLIPMEWTTILPIMGMILVIYVCVAAISMIKGQADANEINKQLNRRMHQSKEAGGERHE